MGGMPPLNTALIAGNAKACLELLNRNADVHWKHEDGANALFVATAWIVSNHNAGLRRPPIGEEPRAVIAMMLHNGVDPTQTEGMSKSVTNRSVGHTPLEAFQQEIARSPWRSDEHIGKKFDIMAKSIHTLLEQAEKAIKLKVAGNKAFAEKKYEIALKEYAQARSVWAKAEIRGHHSAVLWNNEATCHRRMGDMEECGIAAEQGLRHYTTPAIKEKLQFNVAESLKPIPEPTVEEKEKKAAELQEQTEKAKEKCQKQKEEFKELTQAYEMGLGPAPPDKPWWEERDADSDEEKRPKNSIGYLPAHHPGIR